MQKINPFSDKQMLVTEIFLSIQGETSLTGIPFIFIRFTGCNLRCTYCDSSYSFYGGRRLRISEILEEVKLLVNKKNIKHCLITGGEPLLQKQTPFLVEELQALGFHVSIETHGQINIEKVKNARIVLDIKTPGSKMHKDVYQQNFPFLKKEDEIKFVLTSESDYFWAKNIIETELSTIQEKGITILLSPAFQAKDQPGEFLGIEPKWLAERILKDGLNVRFQMQLHKWIWGHDKTGV